MTPTERQSEVDRIATREARDRRTADEQAAWDRFMAGALGGILSNPNTRHWRDDGTVAREAAHQADLALAARRSRNQGDDNG